MESLSESSRMAAARKGKSVHVGASGPTGEFSTQYLIIMANPTIFLGSDTHVDVDLVSGIDIMSLLEWTLLFL